MTICQQTEGRFLFGNHFFSVVHVRQPVITIINTVTDAQSGKSVYLENGTAGKEPCLNVG